MSNPSSPWDAVVLLQMGGPATMEELEPFLERLFADPDIIRLPRWMRPLQPRLARIIARKRAPNVAPRYEAMGGGSPLQAITDLQAASLEKRLGVPVHVAMRYTKPWAYETCANLRTSGARRVLLLPLFPHWSASTTGSSLRDFARAARSAGLDLDFRWVRDYGVHPEYLDLVALTCEEALKRLREHTDAPVHLVLSAHGLPERYIREGDTYQQEVVASAMELSRRLEGVFASVSHGFQSAVGPVKWIGPETSEVLERLSVQGARAVVLAPLGFVSDHIETKYDMDTLYPKEAQEKGITHYERAESFNDRPEFARLLQTLAEGDALRFEVGEWTG